MICQYNKNCVSFYLLGILLCIILAKVLSDRYQNTVTVTKQHISCEIQSKRRRKIGHVSLLCRSQKKKRKKKKEYVNKKKKMSIYCFWYIFFFQLHTVTLWQCNIKKGNMTVKGNVSECHRPKRPDVASRQNEMQSLTIYDVKHHINYTGLVLVCHTVEWLEISTVTFTKDV